MNWPTLLLFCALCGMTAAFGAAVRRLRLQERQMENAARRIADYILDRRKGGIACSEEGAMYRLFHEVNSLVAIADARADSEQQAKEFLRRTISDISHQLKTPIAALNLYNSILQQEEADAAAVRRFAALSEQELDRMESLVQNLLKMARLDAGTITLEQLPENLSELMEHIKGQYSFRAEQEGKEIDLEDTGCGIHPEDLYHIFKRFYRSRFSKDTQGIGLGLPLAKSIMEAHRGSIEVRSELGRGTVFAMNFPRNI